MLTFIQIHILGRQGTVGQLSPLLQDVVFVIWLGKKKISTTQKLTSPGPLWPSPLPSWMSSVLYRAWSLGATANSTMFTSFLKGDSSLGSQNRAGLRGELERQTHPFDFPAFLSDVLHPVKRELLGWSHCSWLIWSPLFQGPSLTSTVMISCSQDYSD